MPANDAWPAEAEQDACPDDDALLAYVNGVLPPEQAGRIELHVDGCEACCEVLAEAGRALTSSLDRSLAPAAASPAAPRPLPKAGDKVGRYHLMDVLGRGAMGVVFAAYDPELDRRVAVKLVRVAQLGASSAELEARLLAEAQAMARLSHPNVVAVYDIGTVESGVYIAMELVQGETLRAWLERQPRTWREVLATFLQAGDGLAAAHGAGIVHRDFKPDNVLVDKDGRVHVTDFGLARVAMRDLGAAPAMVPSSDMRRTRAGTVVGTPAYMAPEQLGDGAEVDARADVFAFGASLYEALYRARAYPGSTFAELEAALKRGVPSEPPPAPVPAWVKRVVMKALAGDRAARHPTMPALLDALRADPKKRLVRIAVPLAAAAIVAGTVALVWQMTTADARACRAGAERAEQVWDAQRAAAAKASFAGTGKAFAADAFAIASATLAGWLDDWYAARVDACDATHERGEQSEALLDLRLRCLDQRLAEADALASVLAVADAQTVENAPAAVSRLGAASICAEVDRLVARVPPPTDPVAADQVARAAALTAKAEAASLTGRWSEGIALVKDALTLAEAAGYAPAVAEATVKLAELTLSNGDSDGALAHYERAVPMGLAAGDDRIAAVAATGAGYVIANVQRDVPAVLRWLAIADAENQRLGNDVGLARESLMVRALARYLVLDGGKEAVADLERAVAREEGVDSTSHAKLLERLAAAYQQVEDYSRAAATYDQAVAMAERTFGAQHPKTVALAENQLYFLGVAGRYAAAEALAKIIGPRIEALYPREHADRAIFEHVHAAAVAGLGRYDEAEAMHRAGTAIFAANLGQLAITSAMTAHDEIRAGRGRAALADLAIADEMNHRFMGDNAVIVATNLIERALALEADGRWDELAALLPNVEGLVRGVIVERSPLARTLDLLGRQHLRGGRAAEAVTLHEAALALAERSFGSAGVELAPTLLALGNALAAAGRPAVAPYERAIAILTGERSEPLMLAEVRFALAQVAPERAPALIAEAEAVARASPYPRGARLAAAIAAFRAGR